MDPLSPPRARRALVALALALGAALAPSARAAEAALARSAGAEAPLPARNRALLLLRVLLYDRNLDRRGGAAAEVAVAYRPGDPASEADRDALLAAFAEVSRDVVAGGRPVSARAVAFRGEADLAVRLAESRPLAVYVCEGLLGSAEEIARVTRRERVLSGGGSRALAEAGISVALVGRGARAAVVVNLPAARAEGAELDAALLALAEVIGERSAAAR